MKKSPLQVPHLPKRETSTPLSALAKSPKEEQKIQPAGRTIQEEKTARRTIQYEVLAGLTIQTKNLTQMHQVSLYLQKRHVRLLRDRAMECRISGCAPARKLPGRRSLTPTKCGHRLFSFLLAMWRWPTFSANIKDKRTY